jgi:outer membrane protein OmpA-like peptidoglycan-associated protein
MFGVFGLGYDIEMRNHWIITPEIKYSLPLNNISEEDWKISSIQLGLALKIPVYPAKELPVIYDTVYVRDTTVIAIYNLEKETINLKDRKTKLNEVEQEDRIIKQTVINEMYEKQVAKLSVLNASITAVGISEDGSRTEKPNIIIEETEVEEGFPILPYIFFEKGRAELDKTSMKLLTKEETADFSDSKLQWNTMDIYTQMLNLIAYRLKQNPGKEITIVGCNNNEDVELNNTQLSKDRANVVKNYLVDVWGIDEKRIKTKWQNLPDVPGNITNVDGVTENQRAEIRSTDYEINKSVSLKDVEHKANPPVIAFYPKVESDSKIDKYNIDVNQGSHNIRQFEGRDVPSELLWILDDEPRPSTEEPINIKFNAKDELGQTANAETDLQLQQLTIKKKRFEMKDDKRIERFFLILFDFNSAELKQHHIKTLNDIKARVLPNSKVIISGFTDRTGDPLYNLELAKRRCLEVQKYLKVAENNLTINPVGAGQLLYDNDIPEGRSYSRTVQIIIETPVK